MGLTKTLYEINTSVLTLAPCLPPLPLFPYTPDSSLCGKAAEKRLSATSAKQFSQRGINGTLVC